MKKTFLSLLLLPALSLLAFTFRPSEPLPIGADMPKADSKVKDISGKELTLKEAARDNGLLVIFSCNTCPVVKGYQERMNNICQYTLDQKIGVGLLNPNEAYRTKGDSYDDMKAYAKKESFGWYYAVDKNHELADAFGATRTPEIFLFNKSGKLVYHGAIDDNPGDADKVAHQHLKTAIQEMMAGKEVSTKKTKSVGCGIKRLS